MSEALEMSLKLQNTTVRNMTRLKDVTMKEEGKGDMKGSVLRWNFNIMKQ